MCTALSLQTKDHYFGRNLDLEYSYQETIVITPRHFPLCFRHKSTLTSHLAMIGMAYVCEGYPLYYDGTNEAGLSMAGLNFPVYAKYQTYDSNKDNITPFEFIPWILGQCKTTQEANELLSRINLLDEKFSESLPLTPLHWMISDSKTSIIVECMKDGLQIFDNPIGTLTNSPSFDMQLFHLNNYMQLSNEFPKNLFSEHLALQKYSNGMGGLGMPGDWSSQSRFVKASFLKLNSICGDSEVESVHQFFHILDAVAHPRGCVKMGADLYEITIYSSCCNTDKGVYYYKTYDNNNITAVDMWKEDLDSSELIIYELNHLTSFETP